MSVILAVLREGACNDLLLDFLRLMRETYANNWHE